MVMIQGLYVPNNYQNENIILYFSDGMPDIISAGVLGGFYGSTDDIR